MKHHIASYQDSLSIHFLAEGTVISITLHYHKVCIPKKVHNTNKSTVQKTSFYALYNRKAKHVVLKMVLKM